MKWILMSLLAVNLAVGGYLYWEGTQPAPVTTSGVGAQINNLGLTSSQQNRLQASEASAPSVQQRPSQQCIRISGLTETDGLSIVESRLRALEVVPSRVQAEVVLRTDYQVIVGPFASNDAARNELQAIAAKGLDSYVITSGRYENALSLGVFSNEQGAERKVSELEGLGISSDIVTREHTGEATQLIISREDAGLITDQTLESVLGAYPRAEFSRYRCN